MSEFSNDDLLVPSDVRSDASSMGVSGLAWYPSGPAKKVRRSLRRRLADVVYSVAQKLDYREM